MTFMYYGGPDTIDWSYILPEDEKLIHIPTNKQGCCPWPWCLVFLRDQYVVLGPVVRLEGQVLGHGLGLGAQVLVDIPAVGLIEVV